MATFLKNDSRNKNIHIVGISGAEGWAMLDFFLKEGFKNVTCHDFSKRKDFKENFIKNHPGFSKFQIENSLKKFSIYQKKIRIFFKENYLKDIKEADLIFVPQSWFLYKENEILFKIKEKKSFLGIINIYFNFAPAKIIGVTGSQGKTTTCRLISHILKRAKKRIFYGGNDKKAVQCLSKIPEMRKNDFLILEISHRHLMNIPSPLFDLGVPHIAVILNVTPNHLDEVKSFKNYQELKKRILLLQTKKDSAILNFDDKVVRGFYKKVRGKVLFFSKKGGIEEGIFLDLKDNFLKIKTKKRKINIIKIENLPIQAKHNLENILAAIGVSFLCKIEPRAIKKGIETFSWPKNCFEYLGESEGVKYYNDLASTTPEATKLAINTLVLHSEIKKRNKIILISGGDDKGMDYKDLGKKIKKNIGFLILLKGTALKRLKQFTKGIKKIKEVKNLKEAVKIIKKEARAGDIALFSPAGAFFQRRYGGRKKIIQLI